MRLLGAVAVLLLTAGCSPSSAATSVAPTPSPSPSPTPRFAIMVHRAGVGEAYIIQIVAPDGIGGASVEPTSRSDKTLFSTTPCPPNSMCADSATANYFLPETSISRTHVYFLDGDNEVKSMDSAGSVRPIKNIDTPANSQVMFAVSPDDKRMAVAVITLATKLNPAGSFSEHMYVEDLATTANRVVLYSSMTQAEWPIAWHAGQLVVATGTMEVANYDNPYAAAAYELVDPTNGAVLSSLGCADGLLVRAGTVCVAGGCPAINRCEAPATAYTEAWDGSQTLLRIPSGPAGDIFNTRTYTYLSPDGTRLAAEAVTDPATGATQTEIIQNGAVIQTTLLGGPQGWLDNDHLIVGSAAEVDVLDVASGAAVPMRNLITIPHQGMPHFVGMYPEDLD